MSSNVSALDQAQAVAPTPAPVFSYPSGHLSVLLPNSGDLRGDVQQAPTIVGPVSIPIPILAQPTTDIPYKERIKILANLIAENGVIVGAHYAAAYHKSLKQAKPPTVEDLLLRVVDTYANFGKEKYDKHHQGSPNAMALRFLADPAGKGYPFEEVETTGPDSTGKLKTGQKCGCDGCPYRDRDRKRHTDEAHVKDPAFALCCPYHGCLTVYFCGSSRNSEMERHREDHEKQNRGEKKGRRGFMPLSTYRLPYGGTDLGWA